MLHAVTLHAAAVTDATTTAAAITAAVDCSNEEKIAWEQWVIPILVNNASRPTADDEASVLARQRLKEHADDALAARLEDILRYL